MARRNQKINVGKHVTLELAPARDLMRTVHVRRDAVFSRATQNLKNTARQEVPVDEGDLLASIDSGLTRKGELYLASGGPGARHAHLIEYGTVRQRPNQFMRRTIRKERRVVEKDLATELGKPL